MALFDGLVAYWKFQFSGTTQKDSGPNALHATKTGTVNTMPSIAMLVDLLQIIPLANATISGTGTKTILVEVEVEP